MASDTQFVLESPLTIHTIPFFLAIGRHSPIFQLLISLPRGESEVSTLPGPRLSTD